jgi:hypothetical protein
MAAEAEAEQAVARGEQPREVERRPASDATDAELADLFHDAF